MANIQTGTLVRVVPHRRRANAQRDGYAYPRLVGRVGRVEECLETTLNVAFSDQTAPNMQRAALVLATDEDFWNEIRTSMTRLNEIHEMIRNRDAMQQPTQWLTWLVHVTNTPVCFLHDTRHYLPGGTALLRVRD